MNAIILFFFIGGFLTIHIITKDKINNNAYNLLYALLFFCLN